MSLEQVKKSLLGLDSEIAVLIPESVFDSPNPELASTIYEEAFEKKRREIQKQLSPILENLVRNTIKSARELEDKSNMNGIQFNLDNIPLPIRFSDFEFQRNWPKFALDFVVIEVPRGSTSIDLFDCAPDLVVDVNKEPV